MSVDRRRFLQSAAVTAGAGTLAGLGFGGGPFNLGQSARASQAAVALAQPSPLSGHPRLWLTPADIPRFKSWATASNPFYTQGIRSAALQAKSWMDNGYISHDAGGTTWSNFPCEAYAELFAFMSLIESTQTVRDDYAQRARTLLMHVITIAVPGAAAGQPFRDPQFSGYDRSRWWGEGFGLTVDWIYPYLSAADKSSIQTVFARWCNEQLTAYNHPQPLGVINSPQLTNNKGVVRWAGNNYYEGHQRNLALMSMALDPADDPGNLVGSYLANAIGAWLYTSQYYFTTDGAGGVPAEGWFYATSTFPEMMQFLLALHTAGQDDPAVWGPHVAFATSPFWDEMLSALLHTFAPKPAVLASWMGPTYPAVFHGDTLRAYLLWFVDYLGAAGQYNYLTSNNAKIPALRWIDLNMTQGGAAGLSYRLSSYLNNNACSSLILSFMLHDPSQAAASDPRPGRPLTLFAPGTGRLLARTDWSQWATMVGFKCGWDRVDHQHGTGLMFEFYRRGEYLTKERSGYGIEIGCSDYKNSLALQNTKPNNLQAGSFSDVNYQRGSQWLYSNLGDGHVTAHSFAPGYVFAQGDATQLYNYPQGANEITHASRSFLWLHYDHIVVYDRAVSNTSGRFKRFWLCLPATATVAGNVTTMQTPAAQRLYATTLLPATATITVEVAENLGGQPADGDQINHRLRVEDLAKPATVRFLHVLQGADPGVASDAATLIQSTAGTACEGAAVAGTVALFLKDLAIPFAGTTFTAPTGTANILLCDLTPLSKHSFASQPAAGGGASVTITPSPGGTAADSGGVLALKLNAGVVSAGSTPVPGPTATPTSITTSTPTPVPTARK